MPYTGEILIILACLGWACWYYGVLKVDIEIDKESKPR